MSFTQQYLFDKSGKPFISLTGGYGGMEINQYGNCIALDKNDRLYVPGMFRYQYRQMPPFWPYSGWLGQYSELGNLNWQRAIGASNANVYNSDAELLHDVAVSPDGDYVYAVGTNTTSTFITLIIKYDKDGNIQWKKEWGSGSSQENVYACAVNSNGDLFFGGVFMMIPSGAYYAYMVKLNSSGVIQQQHLFGQEMHSIRDIVVDDNDNVYTCGSGVNSGVQSAYVVKYDNLGQVVWQKKISRGSGYNEALESLAVDSSGNVYAAGYSNPNSGDGVLVKLNSSGTVQYSKYVGSSGEYSTIGIACDRDDNVYVVGKDSTNQTSGRDFLIVKINSSGTVQWKRSFGVFGRYSNGYAIAVDSKDNIVVSGSSYFVPGTHTGGYDYQNLLIARFLSDGTGTGTNSLNGYSYIYQSTTAGFGNISPAFSATNASNSYTALSGGSGGYNISNSSQSDGTWDLDSTFIVP